MDPDQLSMLANGTGAKALSHASKIAVVQPMGPHRAASLRSPFCIATEGRSAMLVEARSVGTAI
jgi:hypothetical protein